MALVCLHRNIMRNYFKKFIILLIFIIILIIPAITIAQASNPVIKRLEEIGSGQKGPYQAANEFTLFEIISTVISSALALIGAIFLALMLYAGYHWMTARGEEEKVEKAKDTINRAVVGLIIVVGAYAIWRFISDSLIF